MRQGNADRDREPGVSTLPYKRVATNATSADCRGRAATGASLSLLTIVDVTYASWPHACRLLPVFSTPRIAPSIH